MPAPVKVLHMLHDARRGGVQTVALQVIGALDRSRVIPSALIAFDGVCAEELRRKGIEVHTLGRRVPLLWRLNRFLFNLRLLSLARRVDVVHVHSVKLAFSAILAKWLGKRVVYHLHELPGRIGPLLRRAIAVADCVVFCSRTCEEHFAPVPARRRRLLVNAVRVPLTPPERREGERLRIVMLGSINPGKGQDLLLKAFARVAAPAELHFYGNVGLSARGYVRRLQQEVEGLGLTGRVFFHPPTDDVAGVLAETTLLVHTSLRESFGLVLVEAMAAGVPVVAHAVGGMREVVADGVTGYLVPPGDLDGLAGRIDELLTDPLLRERMGRAGWETVRERFNIASRVNDYMELYEELAGEA